MSRVREWHLTDDGSRRRFVAWLSGLDLAQFPLGLDATVRVREDAHTDAQRRLLHAALHEIAEQVVWHGERLDAATWKELLTAAQTGERVIPGIYGGLVRVGASTRGRSKRWYGDLIEFAFAFGAEQGVTFRTRRPAA